MKTNNQKGIRMQRLLTREQLKRGISLAERERTTRWDWGDWAVDVAGPVGEPGHSNGAAEKLKRALEELAANGGSSISDLPSWLTLRNYREAASAIPHPLRQTVRSIDVGRKLAQKFPDIRERHTAIERLANEDGIVTERSLREELGERSKDGAVAHERDELRDERDELRGQLTEAERRIEHALTVTEEPTVQALLNGDDFDPAAAWADKLVLRVHTNVEALTSLIKREGLRFAPSTPLPEMLGWLEDTERQVSEVRAAVQERIRDEELNHAC